MIIISTNLNNMRDEVIPKKLLESFMEALLFFTIHIMVIKSSASILYHGPGRPTPWLKGAIGDPVIM